jgi:hypothetical protein
MRSNAGIANRQGDVDLRFAQVSAPQLELLLGLAWSTQSDDRRQLVVSSGAVRTANLEKSGYLTECFT